jgi:hypothetical protein
MQELATSSSLQEQQQQGVRQELLWDLLVL